MSQSSATAEQARSLPTSLGTMHVRMVGSGDPVVLWHSMFTDSSSWNRIVPLLAPQRRLILVDAPSSGRSEPLSKATDIAGCALAAVELLDGLRDEIGSGPVDWLGNAWGGHVGLHLAATRPARIRTLVAVSAPTDPIDAALRRKLKILVPLYRVIGPRGIIASTIGETLLTDVTRATDPDGVELVMGPLRRVRPAAMALAIRTAILNRTDLGWAAAQIRQPVLFVTTDDRGEWTPERARQVAATMADALEETISGSRVIPAIEQPDRLVAALQRFWSGIDRRAAN